MVELIGIIILALASFVALVALLTLLVFLIPRQVEYARQTLATHPGRSFVVGLVNFLFFGVLAMLFSQNGELLQLIAVVILLALLGLALIGLSGLAALLRPRLYPPHEESSLSLLAATGRTCAILVASLLAPATGWFILAPIALLTSLGAGIATLVKRGHRETIPPASTP
ncbi:MAG: hypothetical protein ACE5E7_15325 [Anaerolineae bacterium]